jgi:TPR repeat protein
MMHFVDAEHINDSRRATYYLTDASHGGCSDVKALLSYINKEEVDKEVIFKQVFDWHMVNQNIHRLKITFNIGWMYYKGLGADENDAKALYYFETSAGQNYTDAQTLLGIFTKMVTKLIKIGPRQENGTLKQRIKMTPLLAINWAIYIITVLVLR